jgi:hypothetical protein
MSASASLLSTPNTYSPCSAPIWFQATSASSSVTDFKYVFDLYQYNTNTGALITKLGRFKVPPRPDNTGIFDSHKPLLTTLSYNLTPFMGSQSIYAIATQSIVKYNVAYGVDYNPGITWYDTQYELAPYLGHLGLTFSTPHTLLVGDLLLLQKTNNTQNPQYNGTCSIISVKNPYEIITDKNFGVSSIGGVEGGTITELTRISGTTSNFYAFNGTRQYNEVNRDFGINVFNSTGIPTRTFLTNSGTNSNVFLNNYETISFLIDTEPNPPGIRPVGTFSMYVITYDINGNSLNGYHVAPNLTDGDYRRLDFGCGPANLTAWGVDFNPGPPVSYYTIQPQSGVPAYTVIGETRQFNIINNVSPWNNMRIAFLNRLGGFDYWNFNWKNKNSITTNRTEFKKVLNWNYNVGDRQQTVLTQTALETYTISTDWLTETQASYLKELITSSEVYLLDEVNLIQYPIVITDNSYEVKRYLTEKLFAIALGFKYAQNVNTQDQ